VTVLSSQNKIERECCEVEHIQSKNWTSRGARPIWLSRKSYTRPCTSRFEHTLEANQFIVVLRKTVQKNLAEEFVSYISKGPLLKMAEGF
jgi:hypothetical protein